MQGLGVGSAFARTSYVQMPDNGIAPQLLWWCLLFRGSRPPNVKQRDQRQTGAAARKHNGQGRIAPPQSRERPLARRNHDPSAPSKSLPEKQATP